MPGPVVDTLVAVTSGANTPITAKTFARYVEIAEDGAAIGGLLVTWPNGTVTEYTAAQQPIKIGNPPGGASGGLVGVPAGATSPSLPGINGAAATPASPATTYCNIKSVAANSNVRVTEYN